MMDIWAIQNSVYIMYSANSLGMIMFKQTDQLFTSPWISYRTVVVSQNVKQHLKQHLGGLFIIINYLTFKKVTTQQSCQFYALIGQVCEGVKESRVWISLLSIPLKLSQKTKSSWRQTREAVECSQEEVMMADFWSAFEGGYSVLVKKTLCLDLVCLKHTEAFSLASNK